MFLSQHYYIKMIYIFFLFCISYTMMSFSNAFNQCWGYRHFNCFVKSNQTQWRISINWHSAILHKTINIICNPFQQQSKKIEVSYIVAWKQILTMYLTSYSHRKDMSSVLWWNQNGKYVGKSLEVAKGAWSMRFLIIFHFISWIIYFYCSPVRD